MLSLQKNHPQTRTAMNPEFHYFYKEVDEYIARQQRMEEAKNAPAPAPTPPASPTAHSSATAGKKKWDFPVSRAYYSRLRDNIDGIFRKLRMTDPSMPQQVIVLVNNYLLNGCVPEMPCSEKSMLFYTIFFSILHEIDAAIKRSADCRRRAAERRQRKEAEKAAATTAEIPATPPSDAAHTRETAVSTPRYHAIAPSTGRVTLKYDWPNETPRGNQSKCRTEAPKKRVACITADHPPPV